jgi:hypothetical protein
MLKFVLQYPLHVYIGRGIILEGSQAFLLSSYVAPPPPRISLHRQAFAATQREERQERESGKEGVDSWGVGGGGLKP